MDSFSEIDLDDASCGSQVEKELTIAGYKAVDGLVNNAAICQYQSALTLSPEDWDRTQRANLRAPWLMARSLHSKLQSAKGSIVNVASVHGFATSPNMSDYAASKGGLVALTRALAVEWAPNQIRVNAVIPGAVDTPMLQDGLIKEGRKTIDLANQIPLQRVAKPKEIADTICFLLSLKASYITGQTLTVDGGVLAQLGSE